MQMNNDFGRYAENVKDYREWLTINQEIIKCKCPDPAHVKKNTKEWTKKDFSNLASHSSGFLQFESLIDLARAGSQLNKDKTAYTPDAIQAQNALMSLAPAGTDFKTFYNLIREVARETKEVRAELLIKAKAKYDAEKVKAPSAKSRVDMGDRGAIDMDGIELMQSRVENPAFDQQAALELLAKGGVKVDASHELKAPLETQVSDAVKAIKNMVTRAA